MRTYKLYISGFGDIPNAASYIDGNTMVSFIFYPGNSDYENFKTEINNQTAQLEDIDGNLMTPEQAIAYVATLP